MTKDKAPFFRRKLSGLEILVGVAVVAYLAYGKWKELPGALPAEPARMASGPRPAAAVGPRFCDGYRELLRELSQGTMQVKINDYGSRSNDKFNCTAEDINTGRSVQLAGHREADPAKAAEAERQLLVQLKYRLEAEPALGPGGTRAFTEKPFASTGPAVVYLGQSATHRVQVRLARSVESAPVLSDAEMAKAREAAAMLLRDLK